MKIYLLRHGETQYNAEKRYLGRTDVPLSPRGCGKLARADFMSETVYVSPLRRTAETAEILFPEARLVPVPGLREMDFGIFEGRTYLEMAGSTEYREWVDGGCLGRTPGGEGKAGFCERVCGAFAALADWAAESGERHLVIVAHGGTQMAVMERYALPRRNYFDWLGPYGGGYVLDAARWREERVLELVETVRYTEDGRT